MSGPAVVIGYIFLIPSVLGIAVSAVMFASFSFYASPDGRASARAASRAEMRAHGIEQQVIEKVVDDPTFNPYKFDGDQLPSRKFKWVVDARHKIALADEQTASQPALTAARQVAISKMRSNNIPEAVIDGIIRNPTRDAESYTGQLDMARWSCVKEAQEKLRLAAYRSPAIDVQIGHALSQAFFIYAGVASFVGGLLGWLLVIKKRVLQCSFCSAVVSAS